MCPGQPKLAGQANLINSLFDRQHVLKFKVQDVELESCIFCIHVALTWPYLQQICELHCELYVNYIEYFIQ